MQRYETRAPDRYFLCLFIVPFTVATIGYIILNVGYAQSMYSSRPGTCVNCHNTTTITATTTLCTLFNDGSGSGFYKFETGNFPQEASCWSDGAKITDDPTTAFALCVIISFVVYCMIVAICAYCLLGDQKIQKSTIFGASTIYLLVAFFCIGIYLVGRSGTAVEGTCKTYLQSSDGWLVLFSNPYTPLISVIYHHAYVTNLPKLPSTCWVAEDAVTFVDPFKVTVGVLVTLALLLIINLALYLRTDSRTSRNDVSDMYDEL